MTDPEVERMITLFSWKRRLRNIVAVMLATAAIALLLIGIFRAELPDLNWADEPTRVLTELPPPAPPRTPAAQLAAQPDAGVPEQPPDEPEEPDDPNEPEEDPDPPPEEPEEPDEDEPPPEEPEEPDAGASNADASVPDVGPPLPLPPEEESAMARAHRLLDDGDPWRALLAFEEASEQQRRSPTPLYWMGVCYVQLGKYAAAQTQFRRALLLDDRHVPSVYGLADALRLNAQTKESVQWYRRYLELSPRGKYRMVAIEAIDAFKD